MDERSPLGIARAAAWLAIAVSLPLVIFLIGSDALLAVPEARLSVHVLFVIAGATWVLVAARGAPFPPLAIWLVPLVAALIVSTVTSVRPGPSREALALSLLVLLAYPLLFAAWSDTRLRRRIEWLVIVMATLLIGSYLAIAIVMWILWWGAAGLGVPPLRPGNLELTLGSPNAVAFYLELLVPLAAGLAWRRWHHLIGPGLILAGGVVALVVTGSRGGWLGAVVGVGAALLVARPWGRGSGLVAIVRGHKGVVSALLGLGLVAVVVAAPRLVLNDAGRIELWRAAIAIFGAHPALGAGPGSWSYLRPGEPIADPATAVLHTPHDILLQMIAETGLIGLLAVGIFVFAFVRTIVRAGRQTDGPDLIVVAAATAGLAAIATHSLLDSQFRVPGFLLLVFLSLAVLDEAGGGAPVLTRTRAGRLGVVLMSGLVLVASVGMIGPIDVALVRGRDGDLALTRGDEAAALAAYQQATGLDDQSQYELGRALALDRLGRKQEATAAFQRVADTELLAFQRAILAVQAMEAGNGDVARKLAMDVIERGAYDPTASLNAALVLDESGDQRAAEVALAGVIRGLPSLAAIDSVPLIHPSTWMNARRRAIDDARANDPLAAADMALWAGDTDSARALVEASPQSPERMILDVYLGALSGGSVDWDGVRRTVRANSTSARMLDWYVRLAQLTGSRADERDGRVMLAVGHAGGPTTAWTILDDGPLDRASALRVPHYPSAMTGRVGPPRPYPVGMLTIEPLAEP